ncbi:hypothetical protein [Neisseria sp.]|uniref:hypothetical protein n=1 Tax=Neisseria sp. TaxID=192066 RepID=UPI0035A182EC
MPCFCADSSGRWTRPSENVFQTACAIIASGVCMLFSDGVPGLIGEQKSCV